MTVTQRWLDAAKRSARIDSDYALAKILGVPTARIGNYRGASQIRMDDQLAVKVAQICGVSPAVILGELMAEKSKTPQLRMVWLDVARQAGKAALLVVAISAAMLVGNVRTEPASSPHPIEVSGALPALDARPGLNIMLSVPGADSRGAPHPVVRAVSHIPIALFVVFLLLRASTRNPRRYGVSSFVP